MTDVPERLGVALEGRYTIERELGAGGMATVWLAHDVRHDRRVAVKVLRPELAAVVGAERFLSEIKTTANLQHPHILPLFDSGEAGSFLFYVMPYVEGESLREKLDREHQLPVADAVALARKIAAALQYAHEQDVVHRDVKPANILISRGEPLVADFGIALALSEAGGGRITETGLSLGTPHYMSPEQATGERSLDKRSDVYALGCILYEMLAGQPPYAGPTAQSVLAQILTEEPRRLTDVRPSVPPHVASAVARCLEKLPADRFETADDFIRALGDEGFHHRTTGRTTARAATSPTEPSTARSGVRRGAIAAVVIALTGVAAWGWLRPTVQPAPLTMVRMALPDSESVVLRNSPRVDLAPDGRSMVYVGPGGGGGMLWYREFDKLDGRPLRGTEGAHTPAFSPDGSSVAFVTGAPGDLRVVGLDGEAPITLVRDSAHAWGVTWSEDGWIYISDDEDIQRVRAQGGALTDVIDVDTARNESWRGWPHAVPGGRHVLFTAWFGSGAGDSEIGIRDIETGEERILARGLYARYASTGHLVFTRSDGTVMAAPLDLASLELTAEPAAVFGGVSVNAAQGYADIDVSDAGTVIYRSGGSPSQELVWVGRDGSITPIDTAFTGGFTGIALSDDGRRVAAAVSMQGGQNIYVKELAGGPWRRVTFEAGGTTRPAWLPGGNRVMFVVDRDPAGRSNQDLWITSSDGTGDVELALDLEPRIQEGTWSSDGEWLVARVGPGPETEQRDIHAVGDAGRGDTITIAASRFDEHSPAVSPDGRWIAYVSDEFGRPEIFVRPFPDVSAGKWQASTSGGSGPVWGKLGTELFYRSPGGMMMSARYQTEPSFAVVDRIELFDAGPFGSDPVHASYDVSLDDQRFLMARNKGGDGDLVLVQNWFTELLARVGSGER